MQQPVYSGPCGDKAGSNISRMGKGKALRPPHQCCQSNFKVEETSGKSISLEDLHKSNPKEEKSLNPQLVRKAASQLLPVLIFLSHKKAETNLTHTCAWHAQVIGSCFPPNIFTKMTRQLGKELKDALVMEGS